MKLIFSASLLLAALQLSTSSAHAVPPNGPAFLEQQSSSSCMIKKVLEHFKEKQDLKDHGVQIKFNFNGEKEIGTQLKRSRFDDQTINSKNSGYTATIRRFDSGLNGDQLDFIFGSESCDAQKIVESCNTSEAFALFTTIRLVDGKCPEPVAVKAGWKTKAKPAVKHCPITEEFCALLKGAAQ